MIFTLAQAVRRRRLTSGRPLGFSANGATAMTEILTEEQKAAMAAQIPLGRPGTDAVIAAAVVSLASEGAALLRGIRWM